MDMIVVKKKRIALIERDGCRKNRQNKESTTSGVWSMLKSVAMVGTSGSESKYLLVFCLQV